MVIQELLIELNRRGIQLRQADDGLNILAPAGALTDELRVQLQRHREEIASLLHRSRAGQMAPLEVDSIDRYRPFPLTDVQHAYWMGLTKAYALGGYTTHFYFELDGAGIDAERLGRALNQLIGRHEMLRAVVLGTGEQQIMASVPTYRPAVNDLRELTEPAAAQRLASVRTEMDHQVLEPDTWPLFDIRLSLLTGARTRMHVSLSLLVLDAFSIDLVFQDLRRFYEEPSWSPPPLQLSFRDVVLHEERVRTGPRYVAAREYWAARLEELPGPPNLPLARQPVQLTEPRFTRRRMTLNSGQWSAFRRRAQKHGLTPSSVLMSVFADVLRLWCRQPSFTLNLTLFNRPPLHPEIDQIVGDFTSLIMLEVPPESGATRFVDRAKRIQVQLMRDLEHVEYGGVQVLRDRTRATGAADGGVMPVVFTSAIGLGEGEPTDALQFFGDYAYGISQTPQVWLDNQVFEQNGELVCNWDAIDELFYPGTLDDMLGAFLGAVQALATGDEQWECHRLVRPVPAATLDLRRSINDTGDVVGPETLGALFEAQVARTAEAAAVIDGAEVHSYGELAADARRMARWLRAAGCEPNSLVAIVMDRCYEQVAAVLAVVLSGAAYLPIDASWPTERRSTILRQADCRVVVTTATIRGSQQWAADLTVVCLADKSVVDQPDTPLAGAGPGLDDLAYVIFTSGSTGTPKGVMIEHRSAVNTVLDINRRFGVCETDRVLALSSLSFDLSVWDIFGMFAAGGAVVLPSGSGGASATEWTAQMREFGVTIWNSVPALLQAWLDESSDDESTADIPLRLAMLSGDWIPVRMPGQLAGVFPGAKFVSLGGATEAAIWSVLYPVGEIAADWTRIPYGRPMRNQTLHVYDPEWQQCPDWVTGEIYIGGLGLARGYWADPERTGQRFVTHPETAERLYRTGDLGRYMANGDIEILGREDQQVKINGYRIELGDVSAAITQHPQVSDAVVTVDVHPATGSRQLLAYVTPAATIPADVTSDLTGWTDWLDAGQRALSELVTEHDEALRSFDAFWSELDEIALLVLERTVALCGRFDRPNARASVDDVVAGLGALPRYTGLVAQWLANLERQGVLAEDPGNRNYICQRALDPDELDRGVAAAIAAVRPPADFIPLWTYFVQSAEHQLQLLSGTINPLELLFPDGSWDVASVLYARNPVSTVQNRVAARLVRAAVAARGDGSTAILELGGGTGATTTAILAELSGPIAERVTYTFTDVSTLFVERARRSQGGHAGVRFCAVDIDLPFDQQQLTRDSQQIVVAANVLHDAKDLDESLRQLASITSSEGLVILIEGTENSVIQSMTVGFIEGFSHHEGRDALPLLSAPEWRRRLVAAGFSLAASVPEGAPISKSLAQHVIAARAPHKAPVLDEASVKAAAAAALPGYMVPHRVVVLDRLPLSANGKVDRSRLPRPWTDSQPAASQSPRTALEQSLHAIWADTLGNKDFGVDDNFFELGGDSLHALRILSRLRDDLGFDGDASDGLRMLFLNPTVAGLACSLVESGPVN